MSLWVWASVAAALAQTGRNAAQSGLTARLGTLGATNVRFLFGLPFAAIFLGISMVATGEAVPALTLRSAGFTMMGALAQIAATALMLNVMRRQGFGLTTAWTKSEPVLVALVGWAVLGDALTLPMLAAIGVAVAGVLVLTLKPGLGRAMLTDAGPAAMGLLAGLLFGLAAIGFRGGIVALGEGGFLIRSVTTLLLSLAIQTVVLGAWLAVTDRKALIGAFGALGPSLAAGFLGALASAFWFLAFSLTSAANVRTVALVEVIFALAVSWFWLGQRTTARQNLGIAILLAGVALLMRVAP
jgi:drug/metabolite transporter (DMT)-like permease